MEGAVGSPSAEPQSLTPTLHSHDGRTHPPLSPHSCLANAKGLSAPLALTDRWETEARRRKVIPGSGLFPQPSGDRRSPALVHPSTARCVPSSALGIVLAPEQPQ